MGINQLVYIRTDGNSQIATGHLVRCVSIADACLKLGMKVCFLVSDKESRELLQAFLLSGLSSDPEHFAPLPSVSEASAALNSDDFLSVRILKTAVYDDLEKELPEITALLSDNPQLRETVFFLDSYYVTEKYLKAIRLYCRTAYLDDLRLFDYPVDLVVNYDVIPDKALSGYEKAYQKAGHTLLGASYTPLRSQFQNRQISLRESVSDVLITTGGSDPYHFCVRLIETMAEMNFNLHIVIGRLNTDKEKLYSLSKELPNIRLYENVTDMAALMESCDLAVSAAGTTLYELCALGVPTISFTMADNQLTAAKAFADTGSIPCAGDIRTSYETVLTSVPEFLTRMSENEAKRKSARESMNRLVDGNGAGRIAVALRNL